MKELFSNFGDAKNFLDIVLLWEDLVTRSIMNKKMHTNVISAIILYHEKLEKNL